MTMDMTAVQWSQFEKKLAAGRQPADVSDGVQSLIDQGYGWLLQAISDAQPSIRQHKDWPVYLSAMQFWSADLTSTPGMARIVCVADEDREPAIDIWMPVMGCPRKDQRVWLQVGGDTIGYFVAILPEEY